MDFLHLSPEQALAVGALIPIALKLIGVFAPAHPKTPLGRFFRSVLDKVILNVGGNTNSRF